MTKELHRCPFCGGEARFYRDSVLDNFRHCDVVFVRCMECGARTKNVFYDALVHVDNGEYKDVAKAWNRREPIDKIVEQLEDYKTWKEFMTYDLTHRELKIITRAIEIVKGGAE